MVRVHKAVRPKSIMVVASFVSLLGLKVKHFADAFSLSTLQIEITSLYDVLFNIIGHLQ
jgi:hypothetical protein